MPKTFYLILRLKIKAIFDSMKKSILVLLLLPLMAFSQGKGFVINGTLRNTPADSYIFLTHKYNDITHTDSALMVKGKFTFKGKTPEPNMYWITLRKTDNPALVFFADNTAISVSASADSMANAVIKGGKTEEEYKAWQSMLSGYNSTRNSLIMQFQTYQRQGDMDGARKIQDSAQLLERAYEKNIVNFIKSHPTSNVGGYIIWSVIFDWPSIPEYEEMYTALGEPVKKGKFGKLAKEKIQSMTGTTIGYEALDFTLPDVNGKNITLSSYKGKYVLVDFWASWCGPCRAENPTVVAAYEKYKSKGFDILGVSLDQNKEKWMQAIQKDNLPWTHVSDLKGWGNVVAQKYGVSSIPFNLLLDKQGKIVAKGLRGPALEAELEKLMGK